MLPISARGIVAVGGEDYGKRKGSEWKRRIQQGLDRGLLFGSGKFLGCRE